MKVQTRRDNLQEMEKRLRAAGVPYIAVNEAKKALFAGAKLKAFHFVVYRPEGLNVLLYCGERTKENIVEMRQWAAIFGDGFRAVFAVRRSSGTVFRDLAGVEVPAEELGLEAIAPTPTRAVGGASPATGAERTGENIETPSAGQAEPIGDCCDTCGRSGVEIARTKNGKTVCVECDNDPEPNIITPGVQGSLLGERYEGSAIGSKTPSMFGDMTRDPVCRVPVDTSTLFLWS